MKFTNRIALVTGAAQGIGEAVSREFAERGVDVAMLDVNGDKLKAVAKSIRDASPERRILAVPCDVGDAASMDAAVAEVLSEFGRVDILVNNAGLWRDNTGAFHETDPATWERRWRVNVFGMMYLSKLLLPGMLEREFGRIINVASVAGVYGIANMVDYSTTKGAMISFTRALAKETAAKKVLVTCVSPGSVSGEMTPTELSYSNRMGTYHEHAQMILFLASDNASYVSGQSFQVDGCRRKL
ncbi:MAG: SDR family oxidoreductase [Ruminococcaceae bacterium]|nr:SDR family oxidoreductase [Oscillospiraceae bacterium]